MPLRILVTGVSGFIGSALTSALAAAGHHIRAASRRRPVFPHGSGVEWFKLPDLEGAVDWVPLLNNVDIVIHLAAIAQRDRSDSGQCMQVNCLATAKLVQECAQHGVKRIIFMSSIGAQAGAAVDHVLTENDNPQPTTAYDRSKLAAEEEIRRSGVPYTILRPVVVYGPGAKGNVAAMMRIAALPLPLPFGSLSNRRSMLSIDNLVQAVMVCLDNPDTINRTFIVCDPEPLALAEVMRTLREAAGRPPHLLRIPPLALRVLMTAVGRQSLWDRIGRDLVASSAELQNIGWNPRVQTRDGLRAMVNASMSIRQGLPR